MVWVYYSLPANFAYFIATLISLIGGFFIMFSLEFLVGSLAFFTTVIDGILLNFGTVVAFFSGRLLPLDYLFPNFYVNLLNPFAYLFYHPMKVYTGQYSIAETIVMLLASAVWASIPLEFS